MPTQEELENADWESLRALNVAIQMIARDNMGVSEKEQREAFERFSNMSVEQILGGQVAEPEVEKILDQVGEDMKALAGVNPRDVKTAKEAERLRDVVEALRAVKQASEGPRSKATIMASITMQNCFHVLIEVLLDIRDSISPVAKGEPKRPGKVLAVGDTKKWQDENCQRVIRELNERTGKRFKFVETNMRLVRARLREAHKEGYPDPVQLALLVVAMKVKQAQDGKFQREYLRPATLFNAEKFWQYAADIPIDTEANEKPAAADEVS
jgi:uncharacterized phage protein (TIGR02220 family)